MATVTSIVDQLDAALVLAKRLGYRIRLEALSGEGGGGCEIRGQKWLFVDLSLSPREQLEQVLATLRREAIRLRQHPPAGERPTSPAVRSSTKRNGPQEVTPAAKESSKPFLSRWQRWYRMVLGSRPKGR